MTRHQEWSKAGQRVTDIITSSTSEGVGFGAPDFVLRFASGRRQIVRLSKRDALVLAEHLVSRLRRR